MSFISRLFGKKKPKQDDNHIKTSETGISFENKVGDRFLKLKDDDCGVVIHGDSTLDIVFTKFQNENQSISETEEALMALAVFIKQPGFLNMILEEFRKIAIASTKDSKLE